MAQTVELLAHNVVPRDADIDKILAAVREDGENIRALARIAEAHERRLMSARTSRAVRNEHAGRDPMVRL